MRLCEVYVKDSYFFFGSKWSIVDMVLEYRVVLLWVTCLLFKVVLIRCQVTLVNRNVTDNFRVGKNGCTKDEDCTNSAICQPDSGLCLCKSAKPNFRNPVMENGTAYGCLQNDSIRIGVGECFSVN